MQTIRELRRDRKWTQVELAHRLGIAPSTVYTWEANKHTPDVRQLRALAQVFGVSMDDIRLPSLNGHDDK